MFSKWSEGKVALILLFLTGFPLLIFIISKAIFFICRGVFTLEIVASILAIFSFNIFLVIDRGISWSFNFGGDFSNLRLVWLGESLLLLNILAVLLLAICCCWFIRGIGSKTGLEDKSRLLCLRACRENLRTIARLCWFRVKRVWYND